MRIVCALLLAVTASVAHAQGDQQEDFPEVLHVTPPDFPREALRVGAEVGASCTMTFDINSTGHTENICGVCDLSREHRDADEIKSAFVGAVRDAIREWVFVENDPRSGATWKMNYEIDGAESPPPFPDPITCTESSN